MMKEASKGSIAIRAVAAAAIFCGPARTKADRDARCRFKAGVGTAATNVKAAGDANAAATAPSGKTPNP